MIKPLEINQLINVYGGGSGDEKGDDPRYIDLFDISPMTLASGDEKGDEP